MARRPAKPARAPRETKARSRREEEPAGALEVVEEKRGLGIADGMTITTTILLLVAILMVDYLLGVDYGGGLFF
jgi:hypothetical protein